MIRNLDVYKEYINCSRPLPEWEAETPQEIKDELKEEPKPGWVHWFFSFAHNLGLPKEKLEQDPGKHAERAQRSGRTRSRACVEKQPA